MQLSPWIMSKFCYLLSLNKTGVTVKREANSDFLPVEMCAAQSLSNRSRSKERAPHSFAVPLLIVIILGILRVVTQDNVSPYARIRECNGDRNLSLPLPLRAETEMRRTSAKVARESNKVDFICCPPPMLANKSIYQRPYNLQLIRERVCERESLSPAEIATASTFVCLRRLHADSGAHCSQPLPPHLRTQTPEFMHFAKTGGETFESLFHVEKNHWPARVTTRHKRIDQRTRNETNFIAVTNARNPYERMFSFFRFCVTGHYVRKCMPPGPRDACVLARQALLESLATLTLGFGAGENHTLPPLDSNLSAIIEAFKNFLIRYEILYPLLSTPSVMHSLVPFLMKDSEPYLPLYSALLHDSHKSFLTANGKLQSEFILSFDAFDRDTKTLLCLYGKNESTVPRVNKNSGDNGELGQVSCDAGIWNFHSHALRVANYEDVLTAESISVMNKWFADDFELFQYGKWRNPSHPQ